MDALLRVVDRKGTRLFAGALLLLGIYVQYGWAPRPAEPPLIAEEGGEGGDVVLGGGRSPWTRRAHRGGRASPSAPPGFNRWTGQARSSQRNWRTLVQPIPEDKGSRRTDRTRRREERLRKLIEKAGIHSEGMVKLILESGATDVMRRIQQDLDRALARGDFAEAIRLLTSAREEVPPGNALLLYEIDKQLVQLHMSAGQIDEAEQATYRVLTSYDRLARLSREELKSNPDLASRLGGAGLGPIPKMDTWKVRQFFDSLRRRKAATGQAFGALPGDEAMVGQALRGASSEHGLDAEMLQKATRIASGGDS